MKAIKLKMKRNCFWSNNLEEIDSIYITECANPGYYKKEVLHDFVKDNPGTIQVNIWPYPSLIPAISVKREKYVRSTSDKYRHDDLLDLPRE